MTSVLSRRAFRKFCIGAAGAALVMGSGAPALAGSYVSGGYYSPGYHSAGHYHGYRGHYRHHRGHHGRHHHRRHHHHGAGKGAAIALGVIGGAIILNELAEERARARERAYYDARYNDPYYAPYPSRAAPPPSYYDEPAPYGDASDDLDEALDGGPEPIRASARDAYEACVIHARAALAERDFVLAAPDRPKTADAMGGAWTVTANVTAQSRRGESWSRAMVCEADGARVYRLELI